MLPKRYIKNHDENCLKISCAICALFGDLRLNHVVTFIFLQILNSYINTEYTCELCALYTLPTYTSTEGENEETNARAYIYTYHLTEFRTAELAPPALLAFLVERAFSLTRYRYNVLRFICILPIHII